MAETTAQLVARAAQAHTNLSMFYTIIAIAESGSFYGHQPELSTIINTAKRAAGRELRAYDRAVAALERSGG